MCFQGFVWEVQESRSSGRWDKWWWCFLSQGKSQRFHCFIFVINRIIFFLFYWMHFTECRHLPANTNFHLHCWVMRGTRWGRNGECQVISLVHCLEERLMWLTKMGWSSLSTTINSNQKSILMRPWKYFRAFEPSHSFVWVYQICNSEF